MKKYIIIYASHIESDGLDSGNSIVCDTKEEAQQILNNNYQGLKKAIDKANTFEEMLSADSTLDAFSTAASLRGKKNMSDHLLSLMAIYVRDMMLLKDSSDAPIILKHYKDRMLQRLDKTSYQDLQRAGSLIQEIHGAFLGNLNEQVVWERLMVGMHGVFF